MDIIENINTRPGWVNVKENEVTDFLRLAYPNLLGLGVAGE